MVRPLSLLRRASGRATRYPPAPAGHPVRKPDKGDASMEDLERLARRARFRTVSDTRLEGITASPLAAGRALVVYLGWARDGAHGFKVEALYGGAAAPEPRVVHPFYSTLTDYVSPSQSRARAAHLAKRLDDELAFCEPDTPLYFHCSSLAGAYTLAALLVEMRGGWEAGGDGEEEGAGAPAPAFVALAPHRVCGILFEGGPAPLQPDAVATERLSAGDLDEGESLYARDARADAGHACLSAFFSVRMRRGAVRRHLRAMAGALTDGLPPAARVTVLLDESDELAPAAAVREFAAIHAAAGRDVEAVLVGGHGGHLRLLRDGKPYEDVLRRAVGDAEEGWRK